MKSKLFEEKGKKVIRWFLIFGLLVVVVLGTTMCAPAAPTEAPTEAPEEAPTEEMEEVPEEEPMEEGTTLAIEHFSIIEGTTWSGAQDRAGKRIAAVPSGTRRAQHVRPAIGLLQREAVGQETVDRVGCPATRDPRGIHVPDQQAWPLEVHVGTQSLPILEQEVFVAVGDRHNEGRVRRGDRTELDGGVPRQEHLRDPTEL